MHRYFIKTPWFVKKLFPSYIWNMPGDDGAVYLSFDDGPHPEITSWVLEELKTYQAAASFFCIGKNVEQYPKIYQRIIDEGHAIGNHSYSHFNGWQTNDQVYLDDIARAAQLMDTDLYRPPYGRLKTRQAKKIPAVMRRNSKIIMWDVLSGDFDRSFSPGKCFENVAQHAVPGSIIVFHDSEKAFNNLKYALPATLEYLKGKGYNFKKISSDDDRGGL